MRSDVGRDLHRREFGSCLWEASCCVMRYGLSPTRLTCKGAVPRLFPSPPSRSASFRFRGKSSRTQQFLFGQILLDVDTYLEVRTFINGDALSRDVAHYDGRLP